MSLVIKMRVRDNALYKELEEAKRENENLERESESKFYMNLYLML